MSSGDSFSLLSMILTENKLTDTNIVGWKRNLNIVLIAKGYKYVLIDPVQRLVTSPLRKSVMQKGSGTDGSLLHVSLHVQRASI